MYSIPVRRLREVLSHIIPDATLGPVEELSSPQLPRLYKLTMSDERQLLLSFAPSLAVRLLRHEATLLSSEATLLNFVAGSERGSERTTLSTSGDTHGPTILSRLIPILIKHSSNNREMAYPYSIFEPVAGAPLSTLAIYLSKSERKIVDKQLGLMARSLASLTSPSGTFGLVNRVLVDPFATKGPATRERLDSRTWSEGFNTLLEGILRDGEDMAVVLPYSVIRQHFQRLSWRLDAITTPRLVILDIGADTNVMVERTPTDVGETKLTGLRTWSQGVFGDPLVSNCFDDASEGFMEGWKEGGEEIIEDQEGSDVRILLYRCYRAVVIIVTEYYRSQPDGTRREMEGRRKLTSTLAELDKIDLEHSDALKRARDSEIDVESCKRRKLESK